MKRVSRFLLLLSISLNAQLAVVAQTSRGTVTGLVTDPQKASVANATVELTGSATNVVRRTQTNETGIFRFDAVDPGDYHLEIKLNGFKTFAANQLTVGAAQVITQDAQMEIGNVAETVTVVETAAVLLRADSPVRGANIDSVPVTQLPYQSRDPVDLGLTVPGVVTNKFTSPAGTFVVNAHAGVRIIS